MKWLKLKRSKIKVFGKKSKLVIKGIAEEHKAFLHNLFTNDINGLKPYHFNYNLRLNGKGYPIQDFFVFNFGDYFF
ncbi:MAG: folate-binding protein, partial [Aquificota bacterium]